MNMQSIRAREREFSSTSTARTRLDPMVWSLYVKRLCTKTRKGKLFGEGVEGDLA